MTDRKFLQARFTKVQARCHFLFAFFVWRQVSVASRQVLVARRQVLISSTFRKHF